MQGTIAALFDVALIIVVAVVMPATSTTVIAAEADRALIDRGEALLGRHHCTACHQADDAVIERLTPAAAPRLQQIAHRLTPSRMAQFIADPTQMKPGTRMPHVLTGDDGREEARAIAHYLSSLPQAGRAASPLVKGEVDRGRRLYHAVGCVACHAPEAGHRPAGVDESIELTRPGTPSEPIALALHYSSSALTAFLRDPLGVRPSGRMPSLKLNEQEATDIAAYLQREVEADDAQVIEFDAKRTALGRAAFIRHRCANCHETGEPVVKEKVPVKEKPPAAASLKALRTDEPRGCLDEKPAAGVPRISLSQDDRQAIRAALRALPDAVPLGAARRVERTLSALNCYACHDRAGKGGVDPARVPFFQSTTDALGDEGRIPPPLTGVGAKLTAKWLSMILTGEGGDGELRSHLLTRMPLFGKENVGHLIADFAAADPVDAKVTIDVTGGLSHHRGFIGRMLLGSQGLNCITCHGLKGHKATGPPAMDLSFTAQRLQPAWFKKMLLDPQAMRSRTIMPAFFADGQSPVHAMMSGKDAGKQIEQMWIYLKELDQSPLPEGMAAQSFVLKPVKEPIVFRTFLEGAGMQAIAVGYPQRIHAAFDAREVRWAVAWRGDFLDAEATWIDRFTPLTKPLSNDVHKLPALLPLALLKGIDDPWPRVVGEQAGYVFRGYTLDAKRVPTMQYTVGGVRVSDRLSPGVDGKSLTRVLEIEKPPANLFFRSSTGKVEPVKAKDAKAVIEEVVTW